MKYRVDLYTKALRPRISLFTLRFVGFVCLVTLLLMAAWGGWQAHSVTQLRQSLTQMNQLTRDYQHQLSAQTKRLIARQKQSHLKDSVAQLQQQIDNQRYVLDGLNNARDVHSLNLSGMMEDLASIEEPRLWLTHIVVDGKQVYLQGQVNKASVIPQWLMALGKTPFFSQHDFAHTALVRQPKKYLTFSISTELPSSQTPAGKP